MAREYRLDLVLYPGEPEAVAPVFSGTALTDGMAAPDEFSEVQGAVVVLKGEDRVLSPLPDPALGLLTAFLKAVPYVLDGESENVLFTESEHGFLFEPSGDDVLVSAFAGDVYEPDTFLLEPVALKAEAFADDVIGMAGRLRDIVKNKRPDYFEQDEYQRSFLEFLDLAEKSLKTYRLERSHGLRP